MGVNVVDVVVFNHKGERQVVFPPARVNSTANDSEKGKTVLILDYCLGRNDRPESAGIAKDTVAWCVVRLEDGLRRVVIGRPVPSSGLAPRSDVFLRVGDTAELPDYSELKPNADTSALDKIVSDMVGADRNVSWAVALNLRLFSVAFVDVEKLDAGTGSGVFVRIEGHLFVATAAHVIPRHPQRRLAFVQRRTSRIQPGAVPILRDGKSESGWPDVGFLEVDPERTLSIVEKDAVGIDRINPSGPGDPGERCFLCGYPSDMILQRQVGHLLCSTFTPVSYCNVPITPDMWPSVPKDARPPDAAVDMFMTYDLNEEMERYEENKGHYDTLTRPEGTSGGGLWQARPSVGLWSAERTALIGIQSSWKEEKKYIRACQIIHWLRLVRENYDDLAPSLVKAFPSLE